MNTSILMFAYKLILAALACVLTYATLWLALRNGWGQRIALDVPNDRSLHSNPVPRIGGMIMVPVALLVASVGSEGTDALLPGLAVLLCAASFFDDRKGLSIWLRLLLHAFVACFLCYGWLSNWELVAGTIVLIWAINFYNFMDGADGLAGQMTLVGFSVFGWALHDALPDRSVMAFSVAGAAAGFLLLNHSPARVFMGDAGSVPLGFLAGGMGIEGWIRGAWPVWFPIMVFAPFVIDASVTLLKRMVRRERFWMAHREHYYQRLIRMGWSHRKLALAELGLMLGCSMTALLIRDATAMIQASCVSLCLAAYWLLMMAIDRRWKKLGEGA